MPRRRDAVRTVTDPRTLRALAHPLRVALLDLVDREGELTATRAAELTGENSANCSFHLRQLGKHGFLEPGKPADGRERPWRRAAAGERVPATTDARLLEASAVVGKLILERVAADAGAFLRGARSEAEPWFDASVMTTETLHLTAEELRDLSREVAAVIERRADARTPRPGTRPARVAATLFPLPRLE